jgi:hypothetical protein
MPSRSPAWFSVTEPVPAGGPAAELAEGGLDASVVRRHPARRCPIVNVLLIVANFAVFIFYELPHLNTAVYHDSFYPCSADGARRAPEPWA